MVLIWFDNCNKFCSCRIRGFFYFQKTEVCFFPPTTKSSLWCIWQNRATFIWQSFSFRLQSRTSKCVRFSFWGSLRQRRRGSSGFWGRAVPGRLRWRVSRFWTPGKWCWDCSVAWAIRSGGKTRPHFRWTVWAWGWFGLQCGKTASSSVYNLSTSTMPCSPAPSYSTPPKTQWTSCCSMSGSSACLISHATQYTCKYWNPLNSPSFLPAFEPLSPAPLPQTLPSNTCPLLCKNLCGCSSLSPTHSAPSTYLYTCWLCPTIWPRSTTSPNPLMSRNSEGYRCSNTSTPSTVVRSTRLWKIICRTKTHRMPHLLNTALIHCSPIQILPNFSTPSAPQATPHAPLSKSSCKHLRLLVCMIYGLDFFISYALLRNILYNKSGLYHSQYTLASLWFAWRNNNGCSLIVWLLKDTTLRLSKKLYQWIWINFK